MMVQICACNIIPSSHVPREFASDDLSLIRVASTSLMELVQLCEETMTVFDPDDGTFYSMPASEETKVTK